MRNYLIPAALLASVAIAAAPAAAQPRQGGYGHNQGGYGHNQGGYGHQGHNQGFGGAQIEREIADIMRRIERLRERRLISANEYRRLRRDAEHLDRRLDRNRRGGLSAFEARDLRVRLARLRDEVRDERREGRNDRNDRW